jgi:hypothetical protein
VEKNAGQGLQQRRQEEVSESRTFNSTTAAASRATSLPLFIAMPTSARFSAGESLTPVTKRD